MTKFGNVKEDKLEIWLLPQKDLHITEKSILSCPLDSLEFLNNDFFFFIVVTSIHATST